MPPLPLLVFLCVIGLLVYSVIGGAVGVMLLKKASPDTYYPYVAGKKNYQHPGEAWATLVLFAAVWPLVIGLTVPYLVIGVLPFKLIQAVAVYIAKAQ